MPRRNVTGNWAAVPQLGVCYRRFSFVKEPAGARTLKAQLSVWLTVPEALVRF
jgi:hypothetical protein